MLEQGNYKLEALSALAGLPPASRSAIGDSILVLNASSLAHTTALFLNIGLWVLFAVIAYLLFAWRGDPEKSPPR
jgi:hypothetical protein